MISSTEKDDINKKAMSSSSVVRNILSRYAQFLIRFFVGIWFARFLIKTLGIELYGLVPLAWNITNYFALITLIMNAPAGRFLIIERSRGNMGKTANVFNTIFWGHTGLTGLILLVGVAVSWFSPLIFKTPAGHEMDARLIFMSVSGAFVLLTFSSPFNLSTYVTNRLDLRSHNESIQLLMRVGIAYGLILSFGWKLGAVSLGIFVGASIGFFITAAFWRRLTPELKISRPQISVQLLKEITGMGIWMLINQIGSLLFLNTELLIVNFLYGAKATGKYGALLIIPAMLRSMASIISNSLVPPIMDRYARNDIDGVIRIVNQSIRLMGVLMALPLGLICGFSFPILNIWLGPEFGDLYIILFVLTVHLCINISVLPLFSLQVMVKKVKTPGIVTLVMGIINTILAVILGQPEFGLGLLGIAMAGAIVLSIKNAIFTPIYGAYIIKRKKFLFFSPMISGITGFTFIIVLTYISRKVMVITSLWDLLISFVFISIGYLLIAWYVILNKADRTLLLKHLPGLKKTT